MGHATFRGGVLLHISLIELMFCGKNTDLEVGDLTSVDAEEPWAMLCVSSVSLAVKCRV